MRLTDGMFLNRGKESFLNTLGKYFYCTRVLAWLLWKSPSRVVHFFVCLWFLLIKNIITINSHAVIKNNAEISFTLYPILPNPFCLTIVKYHNRVMTLSQFTKVIQISMMWKSFTSFFLQKGQQLLIVEKLRSK